MLEFAIMNNKYISNLDRFDIPYNDHLYYICNKYNNKSLRLNSASSGLQSVIPMLLLVDYLPHHPQILEFHSNNFLINIQYCFSNHHYYIYMLFHSKI